MAPLARMVSGVHGQSDGRLTRCMRVLDRRVARGTRPARPSCVSLRARWLPRFRHTATTTDRARAEANTQADPGVPGGVSHCTLCSEDWAVMPGAGGVSVFVLGAGRRDMRHCSHAGGGMGRIVGALREGDWLAHGAYTAVMSATQAKRKPGCPGTMAPVARALFAIPPKAQRAWHRLLHSPRPTAGPPPTFPSGVNRRAYAACCTPNGRLRRHGRHLPTPWAEGVCNDIIPSHLH